MADTIFKQLLEKYITRSISSGEREELFRLLRSTDNDTELTAIMDEQWAAGVFDMEENNNLRQILFQKIQQKKNEQPALVTRMSTWKKFAVAASILLVIGAGYYVISTRNGEKSQPAIVKTTDVEAPKVIKAMITLADGRTIAIDSLTSLTQGNVQLTKNDKGQIVYDAGQVPSTGGDSGEAKYNTLTNPRGSKVIDMTLADGSHVWLNAGSSITYPVAFIGDERRVSITGEAYFEISHLPPTPSEGGRVSSFPFIVSKGHLEVTVLGTHFNVNAYDDEADIKVTLLEGSVKVARNDGEKPELIIRPGQQARANVSGQLSVVSNADIEEVMAWKNGLFQFNRADLQTVMRQLGRYYDVEVVYEGKTPVLEFGGKMQRDLNLSQVLRLLEKNEVHFRIEGRKIVVMP